jgi:hypothetical protein
MNGWKDMHNSVGYANMVSENIFTESAYEITMKDVRTKKDNAHELPSGRAKTRQCHAEDRPEDGEGGKEENQQAGGVSH